MTMSIKSLKTVWQQIDANNIESEDLMSLPTSITANPCRFVVSPPEAELVAA